MEEWELVARETIRDLVARYNQYGDHARFGPMLELLAADAVLELHPDERHEGRPAIRAFFESAAAGKSSATGGARFLRHLTATHQIDVESADAASGRCYFVVLTERGLDHWGSYHDRYRRIDGVWRFDMRSVRVDEVTAGGWADQRRRRASDVASD